MNKEIKKVNGLGYFRSAKQSDRNFRNLCGAIEDYGHAHESDLSNQKGENVMKRLAVVVLTGLLAAVSGFAAEQTWTGKISDSMCGASHKKVAEHGTTKISDHDCTLACVKNGGKYVFVRNGKIYNIENQDYAGLEEHAGETVRLTGDMTGNTIKVSNIEASGTGQSPKS